jgi:hypothetical protein
MTEQIQNSKEHVASSAVQGQLETDGEVLLFLTIEHR